jgi:hypothetical protein
VIRDGHGLGGPYLLEAHFEVLGLLLVVREGLVDEQLLVDVHLRHKGECFTVRSIRGLPTLHCWGDGHWSESALSFGFPLVLRLHICTQLDSVICLSSLIPSSPK